MLMIFLLLQMILKISERVIKDKIEDEEFWCCQKKNLEWKFV